MVLPMRPVLVIVLSVFLAAAAGFLFGQTLVIRASTLPLSLVPDTRPHVAQVTLDRVQNGLVQGKSEGNVRVIARDHVIAMNSDGSFKTGVDGISVPRVTSTDGMTFVASIRGSKYYPVGSQAAADLSSKYITHFATADDAEAAGYHR